jgi:uridine phosphorylase
MTSADFEPFVFEADVGGNSVVLVTCCVWGGPQTAILVEELAALGVRTIVGYGVAGSLDPELHQGSFVVAASALPTDGTTRSYAADTIQTPDPELRQAAIAAGEKIGCPLRAVTAATVDALYRETRDLVGNLREQGGQIIQMECSPLYAASKACGVRSVWLGYVTDCLVEGNWHDWDRPLPNANENAIKICRELLQTL